MHPIPLCLLIFLLSGCERDYKTNENIYDTEFGPPIRVEMRGYSGNIMEPFLSRDGAILLFNNLNGPPENTNLHWATKINDSSFQYRGEIEGVNTIDLEAVPTLDKGDNLYFVSTRNYASTLSTLYQSHFSNGVVTNVQLIRGVSKLQPGWVNFDVEVSADGQTLYFVDAHFNQAGNPETADLAIAQKNDSGFQRLFNSNGILKNINTDALEYAASISADGLELYFTRLQKGFTASSLPEIMVSKRQNKNEVFGIPSKIQCITGFSEAPGISPDQKTLYYHKKENDKFVLYMVRKKV